MKIIKYHSLDSTSSINAIATSANQQYIAFGDSNKQITIFNLQNLFIYYNSTPKDDFPLEEKQDINYYVLSDVKIPKMILDFHTEQVTCLQFPKMNSNLLFSGSQDKSIAIWKINQQNFSAERVRVIQNKCEITDMQFYPDDSYLFVAGFNNYIYIFKCDFINNSFEIISVMNSHDNIVNCIVLDPFIEETGRFVSMSDKGRVIISQFNKNTNAIVNIKDYEEFITLKHKCNIIQKKIDWSSDGKVIITVDHHNIKNNNVIHGRIIFLEDLNNPQILIGHDSPMLVAKFSNCLYSLKGKKEEFQLCATGDRNGNLIIWKVLQNNFSVFIEINNLSESNITNILWTSGGGTIFISNSSGSVYTIMFNEFDIKINNQNSKNQFGDSFNKRKMNNISKNKNLFDDKNNDNSSYENNVKNNDNFAQFCLRCRKQMYHVIENESNEIAIKELKTKDHKYIILRWENNPIENYSLIECLYSNNNIIYAHKIINRLIKYFTNNTLFFAFFDTNFTLNVYSILNTPLLTNLYFEEIALLNSYDKYILLLTSQNRIIIIDVLSKQRIVDENLCISYDMFNVFQTKIDEILFFSLDKIIIKANTHNPYKNTSEKMVLFFDRKTNCLTVENSINEKTLMEIKKNQEKSIYKNYFSEIITPRKGFIEIDSIKLNSNLDLIYNRILKCQLLEDYENYEKAVSDLINLSKKEKKNHYIFEDFKIFYNIPENLSKNNLETDRMDLEKDQDNNNDIEMLNTNKNNRFTQMDRIELDEEQLSNKSENYDNIE
jgi:WD40 repeat protein